MDKSQAKILERRKVRLLAMFGLAATAASIVMAFVGLTSAMAIGEHPNIDLCLKNEPVLCKVENVLLTPAGGSLRALLKATNPELKGSFEEKCAETTATFSTSAVMGNPMKGQVTALSFGPAGKCSPCPTVTAQGLPYAAELSMGVELGTEWTITTKGSVKLENCLGLGITCKFGGVINFIVKNIEKGILGLAEGTKLMLEEGNKALCGEIVSLKVDYISEELHLVDSSGTIIGTHKPYFLTLRGS